MSINIVNKKAGFQYEIIEKYTAGIQLTGTEVKSIRAGKASINEAYCIFRKGELWIKDMHIAEYEQGTHYNHQPTRLRKLLLTKRELKRLHSKVKERGFTIVPLRVWISDRGFIKVDIALVRGKKIHDKRQSIKERDLKREMQRKFRM